MPLGIAISTRCLINVTTRPPWSIAVMAISHSPEGRGELGAARDLPNVPHLTYWPPITSPHAGAAPICVHRPNLPVIASGFITREVRACKHAWTGSGRMESRSDPGEAWAISGKARLRRGHLSFVCRRSGATGRESDRRSARPSGKDLIRAGARQANLGPVCSNVVVVASVGTQDSAQVRLPQDDDAIHTLAPDRPDQPIRSVSHGFPCAQS
jgi:hypothetical protein